MVVGGMNFALFWYVLKGDPLRLFRNNEFRPYIYAIAVFGTVISAALYLGFGLAEVPGNVGILPGNLENSLRQGFFQVISIVTTTGYASMDFNTWDPSTKTILLFAYFLGGSAGTAAGSIKIVRWVIVKKSITRSLFKSVHPESVRPVRFDGEAIDDSTVQEVFTFIMIFVGIFGVSSVFLYLDSYRTSAVAMSTVEAMSVSIATLGNIGPGFGIVGPMNSFLPFSNASKIYMVFLMWIGRLEILSVLVILTPSFWKR